MYKLCLNCVSREPWLDRINCCMNCVTVYTNPCLVQPGHSQNQLKWEIWQFTSSLPKSYTYICQKQGNTRFDNVKLTCFICWSHLLNWPLNLYPLYGMKYQPFFAFQNLHSPHTISGHLTSWTNHQRRCHPGTTSRSELVSVGLDQWIWKSADLGDGS